MTEGVSAAGAGGSFYRGVASIPSRRSLNVQLGPTAAAAEGEGDYLQQLERQYSNAVFGWTASDPSASSAHRSTPRQRSLRQQQHHQQPQHQQLQQQRVPWSRMVASSAAMSAACQQPTGAAIATAAEASPFSPTSASLCQFVDFGETRELIRRSREAAKRLAEVSSIVSHLSLEKENKSQEQQQQDHIGWATFRRQPNSQFKQYVFQSPGRTPLLPSTAGPQNPDQLHQPHLLRSRTTLGSMVGRAAARHSRPEPLGAAYSRGRTSVDSTAGVTASELHREASNLALSAAASYRQSSVVQANFRAQGHSSNTASVPDYLDDYYGQFERRKMKSFRLD